MAYHKTKQSNEGKETEKKAMCSCLGGKCKHATYCFVDGLPCLWCNEVDRAVVDLFKCPNELWIVEYNNDY